MTHARATFTIVAGLLLAAALLSTACKKDETDEEAPAKSDEASESAESATGAEAAGAGEAAGGEASGETFEVALERPVTAGYKLSLTSRGKRDLKVMADGKPTPQNGVRTFSYEAEVTVTSVGDRGKPTAVEHTVGAFELTELGKKTTPIAAGAKLVGTVKDGEEVFEVDGAPVDPKLAEVLREIVSLDSGSGVDDDEIFATEGAKTIGESWAVDADAMARSLAARLEDAPMPAKAENIEGTMTLTGTGEVEGIEVLRLEAEIAVTDVAPAMGPVEPEAATLDLALNGWIPRDPSSRKGSGGTRTMTMHIEGTAGPTAIVADIVTEVTEQRIAIE